MKNGGPAFPVTDASDPNFNGMSLRTYIANKQFPFALNEVRRVLGGGVLNPYGEAAKRACQMADALIAELEK